MPDHKRTGTDLPQQPHTPGHAGPGDEQIADAIRDISEVPAVELITTTAVHLMSAAAVKVGLSPGNQGPAQQDLDEARTLITALAGYIDAAGPHLGDRHTRALRDGLRSLQLAFREASPYPDTPGHGPGE